MKTLVLCVDRDNDIGEKAKIKGPLIGEEENLRAARELGIADPEDTDVNALFGAVKTARELNAEVVTLTGDRRTGIISDEIIARQLDDILEKLKPESVILVTDGAADEQLIPVIQSRIKINGVKTIIVRQSKELEKAYFTITNFLKEVEKEPNLAHLIFVIPGLILLLIAIGGSMNVLLPTMLLLLAIVGIYLIIKGLGFEDEVFSRISEFFKSISIERISIIAYAIAIIAFIAGVGLNYQEYPANYEKYFAQNPNAFEAAAKTILTLPLIDVILFAFVCAIVGRIIDEYSMERYLTIRTYIILLALIVLTTLAAQSAAYYLTGKNTSLPELAFNLFLSLVFFIVVVQGTKLIFIEEINAKKSQIKEYLGKKVCTVDGNEIGKVTKVVLDDFRFIGIKVGRRKFEKENILSSDENVVVQAAKTAQ